MKLEIKAKQEPITVLGQFDPVELNLPEREVFLDGKRVPKTLETIILAGLDTLGDRYLDELEEEMKKSVRVINL